MVGSTLHLMQKPSAGSQPWIFRHSECPRAWGRSYMNSSFDKVTILVIEDDAQHAAQIKERLGSTYDIVHLSTVDPVQLYNYKATNPHSQILIVDLVLNTQANAHEGLETIRYKLWPFDRTAFFIVFSQYLE